MTESSDFRTPGSCVVCETHDHDFMACPYRDLSFCDDRAEVMERVGTGGYTTWYDEVQS